MGSCAAIIQQISDYVRFHIVGQGTIGMCVGGQIGTRPSRAWPLIWTGCNVAVEEIHTETWHLSGPVFPGCHEATEAATTIMVKL